MFAFIYTLSICLAFAKARLKEVCAALVAVRRLDKKVNAIAKVT
jgi:hypothetical protein